MPHLALHLGEPFGTLILTLAVTCIEAIVFPMMCTDKHPAGSRYFVAVIMIILNGMVGCRLLVAAGGTRKTINFRRQCLFSVIIPLAVLS